MPNPSIEDLYLSITINAGEKIINSICLFNTGFGYRESLFLIFIAEEELAKLVMLPFANAAGELSQLINEISPYRNHRIKQKIFTSFGIQNRSHEQLEAIKQSCLYVGSSVKMPVVKPKQALIELTHAVKLFMSFGLYNLIYATEEQIDPRVLELTTKFVKGIFLPAIEDLMPDLKKVIDNHFDEVKARNDRLANWDEKDDSMKSEEAILAISTNPFIYTDMLSYVLDRTEYKDYFKKIKGLSVDEMVELLATYKVILT